MGGWINNTLVGVARAQHSYSDLDGRKYAAIGTNRCLIIYYSGDFYDITPIDPDREQTGADITTTNRFRYSNYYHCCTSRIRNRRFNNF
jgi:hypothetical protein